MTTIAHAAGDVRKSAHRGLRISSVAEKLGISESAVRRLVVSDPEFPRPVRLGRSVVWLEAKLDEYLAALAS
jgi:predicted DNA-binding transcriptional regulator AlpA